MVVGWGFPVPSDPWAVSTVTSISTEGVGWVGGFSGVPWVGSMFLLG